MEIFTLVVNGYQAKMNIMVFVWSSNVTNGLLVTIRGPNGYNGFLGVTHGYQFHWSLSRTLQMVHLVKKRYSGHCMQLCRMICTISYQNWLQNIYLWVGYHVLGLADPMLSPDSHICLLSKEKLPRWKTQFWLRWWRKCCHRDSPEILAWQKLPFTQNPLEQKSVAKFDTWMVSGTWTWWILL